MTGVPSRSGPSLAACDQGALVALALGANLLRGFLSIRLAPSACLGGDDIVEKGLDLPVQ